MSYYIEFILVQFITVCWIWGFEYAFRDGEILGGVGNFFRSNTPEWMNKPLFECKYCMASVHGTIFYIMFLLPNPWWLWLIFIVGCCGMTAIFDKK